MLIEANILKDYRCFRAGEKIAFRPGINLLVGDQGCGKSTLLNSLAPKRLQISADKNISVVTTCHMPCFYHDFEKHNPRVGALPKDNRFKGALMAHFASHGQVVGRIFEGVLERAEKGSIILADEPDMALSIRSIHKLYAQMSALSDHGCQIVAAVHNPLLIELVGYAFSLEHRRWVTAQDFFELETIDREE